MTEIQNLKREYVLSSNSMFGEIVKSPKTVMPDLIPAEDGIFDRHPELVEITGFRLSPE
jgi:hypothetical protein